MNPRVLKCPGCGAPLTFRAPFCAYCRSLLTWDRDIAIERGAPFFDLDFSRVPLPSTEKHERNRAGAKVKIDKPDWEHFGLFEPKVRNGCVVVRGMALDDHAYFGVYARLSGEGDARAGYKLRAYPKTRAWKLVREAWYGTRSQTVDMVPWEFAPVIAPTGEPNEIELRLADSVLQILLNGQHITTVFDAGFGFGSFGWVAGSLDAPAAVVLSSAAAFRAV